MTPLSPRKVSHKPSYDLSLSDKRVFRSCIEQRRADVSIKMFIAHKDSISALHLLLCGYDQFVAGNKE